MPLVAVFTLLLVMASCGSYQYVGVDNDGIYGDTPRIVSQNQDVVANGSNSSNDYYQNYFKSKALEYERISDEGAIFTDIDSYQSGNYEDDTINNNYQGNSGWGQTNSQVTINVQPSFGWGGMWGSPFYNGFYGNRWNRWGGFYDPFYGGYYVNRWNNWGFYDPFYSGFYGGFYGGWYNPGFYAFNGYNNYYGGAYYGRNNVSYSASRRNSYPSNNIGTRSSSYNNNGTTSKYNSSYRRSSTVSPYSSTNRSNGSQSTIYNNSSRRNSGNTTSSSSSNNNSTQYRRSDTNSSSNNSGNYSRSTNSGSSNNNSGSFSRSSGGSSSGSSGGSSGGGRRR